MTEAGIWFVTGVSSGLGRAIARAALDAGKTIVGTVRTAGDRAAFEALAPGRATAVLLDVADERAVGEVIASVENEIGPIAVAVNNAGYGHEGPVESISIAEFRRQFDTNLFGAIAVVQAVAGPMRSRRKGVILNISSATIYASPPSLGAYTSSKAALSSISEVLSKEMGAFGVRVTAIVPGSFRTDWAGRSLYRSGERLEDYDHLAEQREARYRRSGVQAGDPEKFAALVLKVAEMDDPPVNLVVGPDAMGVYRQRIQMMEDEGAQHLDLSMSTDFD
jgi:NAD(P)-dependent dehydrogenase (short-subunit alcohol dehydrogenase family)